MVTDMSFPSVKLWNHTSLNVLKQESLNGKLLSEPGPSDSPVQTAAPTWQGTGDAADMNRERESPTC